RWRRHIARTRIIVRLVHGPKASPLVPWFRQHPVQGKKFFGCIGDRVRMRIECDLGLRHPVTAKYSLMMCKGQPRLRVSRPDDDDARLQPRIWTLVSQDIEAMARPLKLRDRQKRFQCADRLGRDDLYAVETGPEGSNTWDRPLRPTRHGTHRRVLAHGYLRRNSGISSGSPSKGSGGAIGGESTKAIDFEAGAPIGFGRVFSALMLASLRLSMLTPPTSFRWVSATAWARCLASSSLTDDKIGDVQGYVSRWRPALLSSRAIRVPVESRSSCSSSLECHDQ